MASDDLVAARAKLAKDVTGVLGPIASADGVALQLAHGDWDQALAGVTSPLTALRRPTKTSGPIWTYGRVFKLVAEHAAVHREPGLIPALVKRMEALREVTNRTDLTLVCQILCETPRPLDREDVDALFEITAIACSPAFTTSLADRGLVPSRAAIARMDRVSGSPQMTQRIAELKPRWIATHLREDLQSTRRLARPRAEVVLRGL